MCVPPQVALVALSAGSSLLQYQQQKKAQKDLQARQIRQNTLAKKNALQRYAAEQLKIRQVAMQSKEKGYQATLKARKARAELKWKPSHDIRSLAQDMVAQEIKNINATKKK